MLVLPSAPVAAGGADQRRLLLIGAEMVEQAYPPEGKNSVLIRPLDTGGKARQNISPRTHEGGRGHFWIGPGAKVSRAPLPPVSMCDAVGYPFMAPRVKTAGKAHYVCYRAIREAAAEKVLGRPAGRAADAPAPERIYAP